MFIQRVVILLALIYFHRIKGCFMMRTGFYSFLTLHTYTHTQTHAHRDPLYIYNIKLSHISGHMMLDLCAPCPCFRAPSRHHREWQMCFRRLWSRLCVFACFADFCFSYLNHFVCSHLWLFSAAPNLSSNSRLVCFFINLCVHWLAN